MPSIHPATAGPVQVTSLALFSAPAARPRLGAALRHVVMRGREIRVRRSAAPSACGPSTIELEIALNPSVIDGGGMFGRLRRPRLWMGGHGPAEVPFSPVEPTHLLRGAALDVAR